MSDLITDLIDPRADLDWSDLDPRRSELVRTQSSAATGLEAWWLTLPGLNGGGNIFWDLLGRANGTLTNTPTWTGPEDRPGGRGALSFVSASAQYVDCGSAITPDGGPACTICAWYKVPSSSPQIALGWGNNGNWRFEIVNTGTTIYFVHDTNYPTGSMPAAGWHHFALTYSQGYLRAFIDGLPVFSPYPTANYTMALAVDLGSFKIGRADAGGFIYTNGPMDDIRVYNRWLSPEEVQEVYLQPFNNYQDILNWRSKPLFNIGWPALSVFPTDWGRKCEIVIDAAEVDGTLTNFPVLLTEANLPSEMLDADGSYPARNGGGDIRFTSDEAGTTRIPCEIVSFVTNNNPALGTAQIWVKVPSISASVNTSFWLWYNNPDATLPVPSSDYGSENVWDSDYVSVWHLEQEPSSVSAQIFDSTRNKKHLTAEGSMTSGDLVAAAAGNGLDFDGTDDRVVAAANETALHGDCTIEATGTFDTLSSQRNIVSNRFAGLNEGLTLRTSGTALQFFGYDGGFHGVDIAAAVSTGVRYSMAGTFNGSTYELYRDGASIGTSSDATLPTSTGVLSVGGDSGVGRYTDGILDEVRISTIARSTAWIAASHSTLRTPATFALAGTPESPGGVTTSPWYYHQQQVIAQRG